MSDSNPGPGLSAHRIEALTDGIYAVAMTLLVIDLKLPDQVLVHTADQLAQALADALPRLLAWVISFFVLAIFWFGHYRAFSHVRRTDGKLVSLNILQLAFVSLMPFSCALVGEHGALLLSQIVYSLNMSVLAVVALLTSRYIHRHHDPAQMTMPIAIYRGTRIRLVGLLVVSAAAVVIQYYLPTAGNAAFVLMWVIIPLSRRAERASGRDVPRHAPA